MEDVEEPICYRSLLSSSACVAPEDRHPSSAFDRQPHPVPRADDHPTAMPSLTVREGLLGLPSDLLEVGRVVEHGGEVLRCGSSQLAD